MCTDREVCTVHRRRSADSGKVDESGTGSRATVGYTFLSTSSEDADASRSYATLVTSHFTNAVLSALPEEQRALDDEVPFLPPMSTSATCYVPSLLAVVSISSLTACFPSTTARHVACCLCTCASSMPAGEATRVRTFSSHYSPH